MGPLDPLPPPSLPGPPPPPPPMPPVPPAPAPVPEFPAHPPASGGGSKLPWIITAAVAIVAAVVVIVVLVSRNHDTTSSGIATTTAPLNTVLPTVAPATTATAAPTTVAPTEPPTSVSPTTEPPTSDPGVLVVADDTKTFSVLLLARFQTDTTPLVNDNGTFARVAGADDLKAFESGEDHDAFGISVLVAEADTVQTPAELIDLFDPGADVCTDRSTQSGYETTNGLADVLLLDGCGAGGNSAKVVMAIDVPAQNSVILLVCQGQGPSNTDLFDFAQAVGESVVIF